MRTTNQDSLRMPTANSHISITNKNVINFQKMYN